MDNKKDLQKQETPLQEANSNEELNREALRQAEKDIAGDSSGNTQKEADLDEGELARLGGDKNSLT